MTDAPTMTRRVAELAAEVAPRLGGQARIAIADLQTSLEEPLRVAIVGRIKAGKSTLVNALLGQRVAPTDVSECTRMVTWFRFGHPQRVDVVLRDGSRRELPLGDDGRVPATVGVPPAQVAALHVWLSNEVLRAMTLIDTPGLASVSEETSKVTEDLLSLERDSAGAAAVADAVALVLNHNPLADELEAVRSFRAHSGDAERSVVNAVGVLTKADRVGGGGPDAWAAAQRLAARQTERLHDEVAVVVPVVGLVAETAEAALLTEEDAAHLATLGALPPDIRDPMLWSPDRFVAADVPVPAGARTRLVELLDIFGITRALEAVGRGVRGAYALRTELARTSGIEELRGTLWVTFRRRSDALKARQALAVLEAMSYRYEGDDTATMHALRDAVEQLRLDPAMHELAELEAVQLLRGGDVELPEDLAADVERIVASATLAERLGLAAGDGTGELRAAAAAAAGRWRAFAVSSATPKQAQVARVMIRTFTLAFQQLAGTAAT